MRKLQLTVKLLTENTTLVLAVIATLLGAAGILTAPNHVNCETLREGVGNIIDSGHHFVAGETRLSYYGTVEGSNERYTLSQSEFNNAFPDQYPSQAELVAGDGQFRHKVYYFPNGRALTSLPTNCKTNTTQYYLWSILSIVLLLSFPILLLIRSRQVDRSLLLLILTAPVAAIAQDVTTFDSTRIYSVDKRSFPAEVFLYPEDLIITAETQLDTSLNQYPEGVLDYLLSARSVPQLNRVFVKDATTLFPDPQAHITALARRGREVLGFKPGLKVLLQDSSQTICYLKVAVLQRESGQTSQLLLKLQKENERWKISDTPVEYRFGIAVGSTRSKTLYEIITGTTTDTKISQWHTRCLEDDTFSFSAFTDIYFSWFNGDDLLSPREIDRYTSPLQ